MKKQNGQALLLISLIILASAGCFYGGYSFRGLQLSYKNIEACEKSLIAMKRRHSKEILSLQGKIDESQKNYNACFIDPEEKITKEQLITINNELNNTRGKLSKITLEKRSLEIDKKEIEMKFNNYFQSTEKDIESAQKEIAALQKEKAELIVLVEKYKSEGFIKKAGRKLGEKMIGK